MEGFKLLAKDYTALLKNTSRECNVISQSEFGIAVRFPVKSLIWIFYENLNIICNKTLFILTFGKMLFETETVKLHKTYSMCIWVGVFQHCSGVP